MFPFLAAEAARKRDKKIILFTKTFELKVQSDFPKYNILASQACGDLWTLKKKHQIEVINNLRHNG